MSTYDFLRIGQMNVVYATTSVIGSLRNFHSLDCLIPPKFHPPMVIPKTLVFHDCKQEASDAAIYTTACLIVRIGHQSNTCLRFFVAIHSHGGVQSP
ncbi:hypothetical protein PAXRUDRAFT_793764 [Paxillus rubicundulus Ve08.2h10]|uniref:Uncharacterized protein n=1 Tax=Paxillus rubicundulus Ve08.2h10 TaxID=930991 RepID=A0A0D0BPZ8_9AGAM|nr:hypothetical protein PAXRUDRAFT_793764 [Paxillus rubicundulus Ve08.2h10]